MDNYGVKVFESYGFSFPYPFTQPVYPVLSVLLYAATVFYFTPEDPEPPRPKPSKRASTKPAAMTPFKAFCVAHNGLLCLFSWVVFINVFPEIVSHFNDFGSFSCAPMSQHELYWSYLFYLSKIWEFIDTWIILYKGRRPSTLQVYHHMGAVFACWLQVIVQGKTFWIFVCLNSFIHTVMYCYYCCSTLGYRFRFKFLITILQLAQFLCGQGMGLWQYLSFSHCFRSNDFWVWIFNSVYVWPLVALFALFYRRTYLQGKKTKKM